MKHNKLIILLLLTTAIIPFSIAEEIPLYLFYGQGCHYCEKAIDSLNDLSEKYPELDVVLYEIYFNNTNRNLFMHYCSELEQSAQGVPTIFIDEKTFIGFNNNIAEKIEEEIKRCLTEGCEDIAEKCALNSHVKGDFDTINPISPHYSIVGYAFLISICFYILYIMIKRIKK